MKHSINLEPAAESLDGRQLDSLLQLYLDRLGRRSDLAPATPIDWPISGSGGAMSDPGATGS
jgi:hypothetical protein